VCNMVGKNIRNYIQYFLCVLIFVNCICLACIVVSYVYCCHLMRICCHLIVCVVPYVYLLYLMCICCTLCVFVVLYVYCYSYFRCRTAGYKSVSGRSCDRPHRHRFSLVSLCLQANAETVPKFSSCYYMPLM